MRRKGKLVKVKKSVTTRVVMSGREAAELAEALAKVLGVLTIDQTLILHRDHTLDRVVALKIYLME